MTCLLIYLGRSAECRRTVTADLPQIWCVGQRVHDHPCSVQVTLASTQTYIGAYCGNGASGFSTFAVDILTQADRCRVTVKTPL